MNATRRAVFLDRDGVIVRAIVREGRPYPPSGLDTLEILPGVGDALARLQRAGFVLIVVTNQPDVARGLQSREVVEAMHAFLRSLLPIDDLRVCYHDDADGCGCRKPKAGMLVDAAREAGVDLSRSFMVGDRWRDVEAGQRAGCRTVLVDGGYREHHADVPDATVGSLGAAADYILSGAR
jgi:D-glycero-D-manno-heptose 1,7-bisphosphate phosphatase